MPASAIDAMPSFRSPLLSSDIQAPPSPGTHRALRRLKSAHTLGAKPPPPTDAMSQLPLYSHQNHMYNDSQSPSVAASSPRDTSNTFSPSPRLPSSPQIPQEQGQFQPYEQQYSQSHSHSHSQPRQRGRANSDAIMAGQNSPVPTDGSRRSSIRKPVFSHGHLSLQHMIRDGPSQADVDGALETMRWKVIDEGVKSDNDGMSSLRIYVWLILLDAPVLPTESYLDLIHRGASPAYAKIRNDTFRTLTTDPLFRRRVSEASLIRLLNATAWRLHDTREEIRRTRPSTGDTSSLAGDDSRIDSSITHSPAAKNRARALTLTTEGSDTSVAPESGTYVQGMNVLAAPFLYAARSESEAFAAFYSLVSRECPGYLRGAMDGVHKGLALVDKVLDIVDPTLGAYLRNKGLSAKIYAFPSVLTLSACTPPLPEVLRLWDFLFAYGPHLNIICIVAQLWQLRRRILTSPSPNKILRSFPPLNADDIKRITISIIQKIPDEIYEEIVVHAK